MNLYSLLKIYTKIKNHRFRAMGMLLLHLLRRKYTCMSFDPVLGCNLKCRMCYFSDEAKRREMHGVFSDRDVAAIARSIFPYVLKLQIGCGAVQNLLFTTNSMKLSNWGSYMALAIFR